MQYKQYIALQYILILLDHTFLFLLVQFLFFLVGRKPNPNPAPCFFGLAFSSNFFFGRNFSMKGYQQSHSAIYYTYKLKIRSIFPLNKRSSKKYSETVEFTVQLIYMYYLKHSNRHLDCIYYI